MSDEYGSDFITIVDEDGTEFELEVLETTPVEYRCYCSRERVSRALISMGREELSSLIEEQGEAHLTCQFCDKVYDYSKEELVAEIGAATLVNHVGIETSTSLRNNAAYIQNWLTALKNDKRFIVSAAGKAEKAVNLILGTAV